MTQYVSLLRAINVGGRNVIKMAALKEIYAGMGLTAVVSHLQSGNVVFETERTDVAALGDEIEANIDAAVAFRPQVILRSVDELKDTIASNPFPAAAKDDPSHLLVMFLKLPVSKSRVAALAAANRGAEEFKVRGRDLYLHYPDGIGRSKFTNAVIERALETEGTARNWNTLNKVFELAGS